MIGIVPGVRTLVAGCSVLVCLALLSPSARAAPTVAEQTYRSDDWVTKCDARPGSAAAECSIAVPFAQTVDGEEGSFALVVILRSGDIAIVGHPFPTKAVLQVGKYPPIECRQPRYCLFRRDQARAAIQGFADGALVLIDVTTGKRTYRFSVSTKGYQAGLAYVRAWGYRFSSR